MSDEHDDDLRDAGVGTQLDTQPLDTSNPDVLGTARRKYGKGGALLAAGMLGIDKVLADKKKTESVQVQEATSDPVDMDAVGITVTVDSTMVAAPALEPKAPVVRGTKKPRR